MFMWKHWEYVVYACSLFGLFVIGAVWMHRWQRVHLSGKQVMGRMPLVIGGVMALMLGGGFYLQVEAVREARYDYEQMAIGVAPSFAYMVQQMDHASLNEGVSEQDPRYLRLLYSMIEWERLNPDLLRLYTLRKGDDGFFYYIMAPEADLYRDGEIDRAEERRIKVGTKVERELPEMEQALQGKTVMQEVPVQNGWGMTITAFAPIYNGTETPDAVMGIDFDGDSYQKMMKSTERKTMTVVTVPYLLIFALYILVFRYRVEDVRTKRLAYHDQLTGLPNRQEFYRRLEEHLRKSPERRVAVMFIDIDNFKQINDTYGHSIGDRLLQRVAVRLSRAERTPNSTYRWGGDEFLLLLPEPLDRDPHLSGREKAFSAAYRTLDALADKFEVDGLELFVTASIGVSLYPTDALDGETLVRNADMAMYRAKNAGKNRVQFYTESMHEEVARKLDLEKNMYKALEQGEFMLFYQPKVTIADGTIVGLEALLRWEHPQRGMISPAEFIPVAEESGLILPIGEFVLREACKQMKEWLECGYPLRTMAVNLSTRQFQMPNLVDLIADVLKSTGLPAQHLELEITESFTMNIEQTLDTLYKLRELGVTISIDDFGTGYSSLRYLQTLPVQSLKIDQSFVRKLTQDDRDGAIVTTILMLARSLDLVAIAEGVETMEQLAFLQRQGCDAAQGYLFSKPLPKEELEALFEQTMSVF
jgi:diguanylate cyclase (GGDEF)-like protein